jgi:mannitol 2-dehydrogenase
MLALSRRTLPQLPAEVERPRYARAELEPGIVHLGLGAFHRAHQALYLDELFERHGLRDWAICGIGMREPDRTVAAALDAQDGLFTVLERAGDALRARVVGSHLRHVLALDGAEAAIEALAAASTRLVTLTITEAGYCCDDASGALLPDHPDVAADLARLAEPRSAAGLLVAALARRRARGLGPFSVLSCDNLEANGELARRMVVGFAERVDPELARHVERDVAFPSSMVDRITPVTRQVDRELCAARFGYQDQALVVCEPFRQWVVEDVFCAGRPPLERVGVELTGSVAPYERMKLRLLNGGHSLLGYLGHLAGFTFIHDAARDPDLAQLYRQYMADEITPLLGALPGVDLPVYQRTLVERFSNAALGDRVSRICMNGSAKVPKFLLASLREQLARELPRRRTLLAVAGFCRYLAGTDERGASYDIDDPLAAELRERARAGGKDPRPLLGCRAVFGDDLLASEAFVAELGGALAMLYERGVRATLQAELTRGPADGCRAP